jgi:hypothetical protein
LCARVARKKRGLAVRPGSTAVVGVYDQPLTAAARAVRRAVEPTTSGAETIAGDRAEIRIDLGYTLDEAPVRGGGLTVRGEGVEHGVSPCGV